MLSGLLIAGLYLISITIGIQLIHVYTSVIVLSIISTLFQPAISAAIPSIVNKEELVDANVFNSTVLTIGQLLAPIMAGLLYGTFGLPIVLLINSVSFICSSISEMFISIPKQETRAVKFSFEEFRKDFMEGLSFVKEQKQLRQLIGSALIINIALNPVFSVGMIVIVKTVIKASDLQFGYMETILVIGTLIGTLLVKPVSKRLSLTQIFLNVLFTCGIVMVFMAMNTTNLYLNLFSTNIIPYLSFISLCFIVTMTVNMVNIALFTMLQQIVPIDKLGRVSSITTTISMAAIPVGQIIFSAMFEYFPKYIPMIISSIIVIGTAIYGMLSFLEKEETAVEQIQVSE